MPSLQSLKVKEKEYALPDSHLPCERVKPEFKNKEERSRGDGLRFPSSFLEGERSVKE